MKEEFLSKDSLKPKETTSFCVLFISMSEPKKYRNALVPPAIIISSSL
jgi:hypothetical protein